MNRAFRRTVAIAIFTLVMMAPARRAHAYMDPGTGSYLFQLLMAGILGALFAIKMYWKSLKAYFKSRFSKNQDTDKPSHG